ncbi:MAG: homocysteine S-methyltransferase family protein, partial [Spirochaetaceae bacterium]|nr:homocysteine S-methyltransferase family protein [Spirochaetaceae bacterium]
MRTRILLLDGPKGTLIQAENLGEADFRGSRFSGIDGCVNGDNDLLCLTRPPLIASIHERHLAAGSDIIETNTFNANRISQADFGMEAFTAEMNEAAALIARSAADAWTAKNAAKRRFVAGSIGPTTKTSSISPDVEDPGFRSIGFDELEGAYFEQATALAQGGVDLFIIETVFDTLNGKAALVACEDAAHAAGRDIPVMVSGTIVDASGRNLSGQTVAAFLASMWRPALLSIGINCSLGARAMKGFLAELAKIAPCPTSAHPNAGLPNEMGGYDESPEAMAAAIEEYCAEGLVNIVGGCCGSRPAHIEAIGLAASRHAPRVPSAKGTATVLSGLEALRIESGSDFVNVGERCNVAGSRKFARLIREGKYNDALAIARDMVDGGAQVIDICMDEAMIDARSAMAAFVNLLGSDPEIARWPFMIDSSDWRVVLEGLKRAQGKCVVNSISLKEGEDAFLSRARDAARYGAAVVVMLFDERGQADTYDRKIEVASRAHRLLVEAGFPPEDIVFDPNILAVGTGIPEHDVYARDFIRACSWIRAAFPGARISGGVSNLSFAFRGMDEVRDALHSVFLFHAHQAGMDMGIVNPGSLQVYDEVEPELRELAEDLVLYRRADASGRLLAYAERLREAGG